ncbi:MAG: undecaprenyl-phosphate glucose phosphotransferase [Eubacteriales bacterium]
MIKKNQAFLNGLHLVLDGALVFFAFALAYALRFHYFSGDLETIPLYHYGMLALISTVQQPILYIFFGVYGSQRRDTLGKVLFRLCQANILGFLLLMMGLYATKYIHISRLTLGFFLGFETILLSLKFILLRLVLRHYRKKGYNQKHVFLVGSGTLAQRYWEEIEQNPAFGYHIIGYIGAKSTALPLPYYGDFTQLAPLIEKYLPDEVVVAMSPQEYEATQDIINICESTGTKMSMIPFYTQFFPSNPRVDFLNNIPMLHLRPIPLEHFFSAFLKRMVDFWGSLCLILLLSPLLCFIALGVKLTTKGSVIFCQTRVGKDKKEFLMFKFRSMDENGGEHTTWSKNNDPRKTKFGSFLRKCSLDELPQLWNVLRGDMSLVGPRPEIPHFVEQFKKEIPHYMVKHQVRPGMTGWAQVSGLRGDTSIPDRIGHDIFYIENWTFFFDLKIFWLTLWKGLVNRETLA